MRCANPGAKLAQPPPSPRAPLGDFDLGHVDKLPDYAKATWYLHVTNFPESESVGSTAFEAASRRKARQAAGPTEGTRMVRRAWTLLDRAYTQCRRAITYLRYVEGDYGLLIPSLRTHEGPKGQRKAKVQEGRQESVQVRAEGPVVPP